LLSDGGLGLVQHGDRRVWGSECVAPWLAREAERVVRAQKRLITQMKRMCVDIDAERYNILSYRAFSISVGATWASGEIYVGENEPPGIAVALTSKISTCSLRWRLLSLSLTFRDSYTR
jgi:hypothetical protein